MIRTFLTRSLVFIVNIYQLFLSPFCGRSCRFYPSCSAYAKLAIMKYGPYSGLFRALYRILRCNPLNKNCGIDNP
ncbi:MULTISPECIES: membrane protein insertion efficiency factor YidD [Candidatus Ichthyocystis]|uniref:membrane protein insertion efficiency factor YidD n=1 Tax=Candidatus Ichthyocystis TaxID=2929841 RepID=UPI000B894131|nr:MULTISPECIES: membrane protein insertion efficiency factor YidD [Ichthyocystis]